MAHCAPWQSLGHCAFGGHPKAFEHALDPKRAGSIRYPAVSLGRQAPHYQVRAPDQQRLSENSRGRQRRTALTCKGEFRQQNFFLQVKTTASKKAQDVLQDQLYPRAAIKEKLG